ncbi:MAG TPA: phenylalanine--tRNA ligase beta subunit-related protein [Roseiflexaceae bacterium]|nr:phenylalanine--tRNA ligase beta subunit-related protein [Roseiflexaceae bacterium]
MHFEHAPTIWQQFPQLVAGLLLVDSIDPQADVTARLEPFFERARERLASATESDLPEVAAWRRAYAQMGMKPTQYRSAAESLLRRFRKENTLPRLHPLVDLCNAVSLAFALPVAAFDLDQVAGFIHVRHADGDERYLAFSGEIEHPPAGEVIFADAERHAHARRWTFRQSRRSTVGPTTRRALIVSEGLHPSAPADIAALLATLSGELAAVWSAPAGQTMLSAAAPRFEITSDG